MVYAVQLNMVGRRIAPTTFMKSIGKLTTVGTEPKYRRKRCVSLHPGVIQQEIYEPKPDLLP